MEDIDFRGNISIEHCSPSHWCFELICNISNILSEHFKKLCSTKLYAMYGKTPIMPFFKPKLKAHRKPILF